MRKTTCSTSSMVPVRLRAGTASARWIDPGRAAAAAAVPRKRRKVRRSVVVMGGHGLQFFWEAASAPWTSAVVRGVTNRETLGDASGLRGLHALGRQRQVADPASGGVGDRVRDGRDRGALGRLTGADRALLGTIDEGDVDGG